MHRLALAAIICLASISVYPAFAQTCLDLSTCPNNGNILEWMVYPFELQIGSWIYIIVWGGVLSVAYIRTQSAMTTGVLGLLVFVAFLGTSTYAGSSTGQVFYWGLIILSFAIGGITFYLIWSKSRNP